MKRKLAYLLAGCLAVSPISAGIPSYQAFASETETVSDTLSSDHLTSETPASEDYGSEELPEEERSQEHPSEEGSSQISSEEISSEDISSEDISSEDISSKESGSEESEEILPEESFSEEVSPEEELLQDDSSEMTGPADSEYEEAGIEGDEDSASEDTDSEDTDSEDPEADPGAQEAETLSETDPSAVLSPEALAVSAPAGTSAAAASGWVEDNGQWSYIQKDGSKATGILNLGTSSFYLDSNGIMKTGWVKDGSNYYYADPEKEGRLSSGWLDRGGYTYYLDPNTHARKTGIQKIDGKLYVFSDAGKRRTGNKFVTTSAGKVFVDDDNTLHYGWLSYNGRWYFFQKSGIMKTGKLVLGERTYFLNSSGVRQTGWYKSGNYKYYLGGNGVAVTGWRTISGKRYNFKPNGVMRTGWFKPNGKIRYFAPGGYLVTGFKKIGNYKYYLRSDGAVTKGWKKISGKWYYFSSACRMKTGWLTLGTRKFYLGSDGVMTTGTKTIDGVTYYFDSEGVMVPTTNSYSNTKEFINCIAPLVAKYAPKYNVKAYSAIIAQAILESASGASSLAKKYNNFFGLKCGTLWTGKSVNLLTGEEYTPGTYTTIAADFRVFDNMDDGVKGYFEFLFKNRTRYNNLIGESDPYRYLQKIKDDGYATSSKYVENTYNVIKSYDLFRFDP